jgi:hypothetical protein
MNYAYAEAERVGHDLDKLPTPVRTAVRIYAAQGIIDDDVPSPVESFDGGLGG